MGQLLNYMPFLGQGLNMGSSLIGSMLTNRANKKMADEAYKREINMWRMNNTYNSPSSQMARFKQAGLNPNLIYGQGSAGNSASIPHYTAPRQEYNLGQVDLGEATGKYIDVKVRGQQLVNMQEQNRSLVLDNERKSISNSILRNWGEKQAQENWRRTGAQADVSLSDFVLKGNQQDIFNSTRDERIEGEKSRWLNEGLKGLNYSATYQNLLQDNSLKALVGEQKKKDIEFLNYGGKYAQPLIQFLRLLLGR
nr:MAG: DNA pilot protein [Microvirus sp.]